MSLDKASIDRFSNLIHEKYSENLFKFLKTMNRQGKELPLVYSDSSGDLWTGYYHDGDFIGGRILPILCGSRSSFCYSKMEEMTPEINFWSEYERIGRCAIDRDHSVFFLKADFRYTDVGDKRTCNWCGCEQRLERWQETIEKTKWVNA